MSDLWQFRLNDSMWTWVSGFVTPQPAVHGSTMGASDGTTHPGARYGPLAWFDPDYLELWLFGGGFRMSGTMCTAS